MSSVIISPELLQDAKDATEYYPSLQAAEEEEQVSPSTFFNKGSVVVFPVATQDEIKQAGSSVLGKPIDLTFKQDVDPSDKWICLGENTILTIETDCNLLCVPHSYKTRSGWATVDLSRFDEYSFSSKLDLSIESGQSILMAHSIPWLLKEGRVKAYIITEAKKMATTNTTTTNTSTTVPPTKLSTFSECVVKHAELKERVARLDQRVWTDQGANAITVNRYETTLNGMSDKKEIANYAKSLYTLEKRVVEAENDVELPKVLAKLEEIRVILDDPEKTRHIKANSLKPARNHYEKWMATDLNLIGKAKVINDLLVKLKGLAENNASASVTPKVAKPAKTSPSTPSPSPASNLSFEVPQIDEDALTPHLIDHENGPDGYKAIIQSFQSDSTAIGIMVQSLKNDQVTALYQKWMDERKSLNIQVSEARRDPTLSVNVTLYVAYGKALKEIYSITKKHNNSNTNTNPIMNTTSNTNSIINTNSNITPAQVKFIKCEDCGKRAKAFEGGNLCKACWTDGTLAPILEKLDDRCDYLARLAKREKEENGPMNTLYDEYCEVHEELTKAYNTFEVPNSSAKAWEKLKELIAKSDSMLPKKGDDGDEDEEDYDSNDADDIVMHSDEEEEEEDEEDNSADVSSRATKKTKHSNESGSLAHDTLLTLHRIPVLPVREAILDAYSKKQYAWVQEELKRLDEVEEVYGFTVQSISKNSKGDEVPQSEPEEWHTYYLKKNDAVKQANEIRIPDKIKTEVKPKKVEKRLREDEKKEKEEKKHKKDEEEEEEQEEESE